MNIIQYDVLMKVYADNTYELETNGAMFTAIYPEVSFLFFDTLDEARAYATENGLTESVMETEEVPDAPEN